MAEDYFGQSGLPPGSVNQRFSSNPAMLPQGWLVEVGNTNAVLVPLGVMRPIRVLLNSVNQRFPSGLAVMPSGPLAVSTANSELVPLGVMRPMPSLASSVNQRLPSGLAVMP